MRNSVLIIILMLGIMTLAYGCGKGSTQAESTPPVSSNINQESLVYNKYKVVDVREAYRGVGDASNYEKSIIIVLEDTNKTRYFVEYNLFIGIGMGKTDSSVDTYNNLRIVVPGDYIEYCTSNYDFRFITDEAFYNTVEEK